MSRVEQEVLSSKCNPQSIKLSLLEKRSSRTLKTVKQGEKQTDAQLHFLGGMLGPWCGSDPLKRLMPKQLRPPLVRS